MTQKDKVKELVGRGLDSYHTKALQQIDRIEKKNKEQNHKINILTNELDNDYLTKTEEGSVISLEHSKEGMIYIDELQGNTLVNYCTDGSKELTLNGDINAEGTSITLTEGVDNGKVDVMCEGNTLVNCILKFYGVQNNAFVNEDGIYKLVSGTNGGLLFKTIVKPNTTYTLTFNVHKNVNTKGLFIDTHSMYISYDRVELDYNKGIAVFRTKSDFSTNTNSGYNFKIATSSNETSGEFWVNDFMLLEGDWSNKEIPPYFEGMKSVGECEDNKIEILSASSMPNLLLNSRNFKGLNEGTDTGSNQVDYIIENGEEFTRFTTNKETHCNHYWYIKPTEPRRANETYTISFDYRCSKKWNGYWYPSDNFTGEFFPNTNNQWKRGYITKTLTTNSDSSTMLFGVSSGGSISDTIDIKNIKLEKGSTPTRWLPNVNDTEYTLAKYTNKKEISLSEPLRGLPNGVCDKFVKQGGKWYVERNIGECVLSADKNISWSRQDIELETSQGFYASSASLNLSPYNNDRYNIVCDKLPVGAAGIDNSLNPYAISFNSTFQNLLISIPKNVLSSVDSNGFNAWLSKNPTTFIYQLATPTYEEITDPQLITYLDTTHISTNSTIHCNMQVKNSGYNAIIKPSTQYTVAFDTNKSGEVGINLGGAKVTTTNNVATVTTPSTLTDDSLRLYGKGIKGSKVRLLEGNKTNWIPSHFEGMKSSFEDKLQDDGTYKMEILMKNRNLFDCSIVLTQTNELADYSFENNVLTFNQAIKGGMCVPLYVKKGYKYYFNGTTSNVTNVRLYKPNNYGGGGNLFSIGEGVNNTNVSSVYNCNKSGLVMLRFWKADGISTVTNFSVTTEPIEDYVPNMSNKIQFSSIEPLRGVDDIKDRFIFKDGKLMIERNCGHYIFNENTPWIGTDYKNKGHWIRVNDDQIPNYKPHLKPTLSIPSVTDFSCWNNNDNELEVFWDWTGAYMYIFLHSAKTKWDVRTNYDGSAISDYMKNNPIEMVYELLEPTCEEIPHELQKIILEGYVNGTLFLDTNIPPTVTTTYAGETPIVKSVRLNKTEVLKNTDDINDNIVPYLMDMDYRVVCLQLEGGIENVSMARLFGGTFEMLQRDIQSKRYSVDEYKYRLEAYLSANKITHEEYTKLGDMLND